MAIHSTDLKVSAAALSAVALWGLAFPLIQIGLEDFSPIVLGFLRFRLRGGRWHDNGFGPATLEDIILLPRLKNVEHEPVEKERRGETGEHKREHHRHNHRHHLLLVGRDLGELRLGGLRVEREDVLEALGLAGDITIYGKKENVLLIREEDNGQKVIKRLNLNSQEIFNSPYYFLRSNDVIYVEPSKDRVAREKTTQILPIVFSLVSLLIVVLDRVAL